MGDYEIPLGQARVVRQGTDVTMVSWGQQVKVMEQAVCGRCAHCGVIHDRGTNQAAELQEEGISCEVIDLRTLLPWDTDTVGAPCPCTHPAAQVHCNSGVGEQDGAARGLA